MNFDLEKSLKYISERLMENPSLPLYKVIEEASLKFDLSPLDADFLLRSYLSVSNNNRET